MANFIQGAATAVNKVFCGALRGGSNIAGLFPDNIATDAIEGVLSSASLNLCNRGGGDSGGGGAGGSWSGGVTPPMFEGAQCTDKTYRIGIRADTTFRSNGTPSQFNFFYEAVGAIKAPQVRYEPNSNNWEFWGVSDSGEQRISAIPNFTYNEPSLSVTSVCLRTGNTYDCTPEAVNDCGNPESDRPEKIEELDEVIPLIEYDDIDGNPVSLPDVPIKFFEPCVNLDGVRIPFELETPFGKVCGKVGVSGDIPNIAEPSIDIDLCPSQKEDLGLGESDVENYFDVGSRVGATGSSDYDGVLNQGYDLEALPVMGVFIDSFPSEEPIAQTALNLLGNKPNLLIPRIGHVIFEYLVATSETEYESAYSMDYPIKLTQQFIPCPYVFGAISVKVFWQDGWTGNYRLAKRKSCCDSCSKGSPEEIVDKLDRCRLD